MKTTRILLLLTTFLLFPWCASQLFSQQEGAKKVVITRRTVDADGSESSETIVKKGAAAEKFDVDKYIAENRCGQHPDRGESHGRRQRTQSDCQRLKIVRIDEEDNEEGADDEDDHEDKGHDTKFYNGGFTPCNNNGAFLGVDEDSDERADQPGLVVNVVRGSAADRAGLHDNDKILKLNDTPTNRWSDLSKFVNAAKVGDKVRISYERNGKAATTEATLTKPGDVKCEAKNEARGFMGVTDDEESDERDEPGLAVRITRGSGAEKAGLQNGNVIFQLDDTPIADFEDVSDFMAYTKPGDKVNITYERNGQRNTQQVTLGEQKDSWNLNTDNWNLGDLDPEKWMQSGNWNKGNCTVNVGKKMLAWAYSPTISETPKERVSTNLPKNQPPAT